MKKIIIVLSLFLFPTLGCCEQEQTFDKNKDGKIDMWLYRDEKGIPIKWVRDANFDGKDDSWSFFKNGEAFLDEEDLNGDGKVDRIIINIFDSEEKKSRGISIFLKDPEKNVFIENEDTGWQPIAVEQQRK